MADPHRVARDIERAYAHFSDGDPEGGRRALSGLASAFEALGDPDDNDVESIYVALALIDEPRALVFFAAQAVLELRLADWDAEAAFARLEAPRMTPGEVRRYEAWRRAAADDREDG